MGRQAHLRARLRGEARSRSGVGGQTATKGMRPPPICGVGMSRRTQPSTKMTPCPLQLPPWRLSGSSCQIWLAAIGPAHADAADWPARLS
eukprot:14241100-Alexandrium_andersonii.AAC.1